ncbi:hypothetical protein M569_04306, partial [Genlisea aurea]
TILYNGGVIASGHVTELQARAIKKMLLGMGSERMRRRRRSAMAAGLSVKNSLQRFLQKRRRK